MKFLVMFCAVTSVLFFFTSCCSNATSTSSIPPVRSFDLNRYLGTWYEIARLPHSFEKGMTDVVARYVANQDGTVKVINSGMKKGARKDANGVAKFKGEKNVGWMRVSFFRPFYGDYKIIYLEEDYSAAIVTSGTMDYLWILSRTPELPKGRLNAYMKMIETWGFASDQIIFRD